ncbi:MAG: hypothetical protein ACI4IF_03000 [Acutalibacteraceae bacterium]
MKKYFKCIVIPLLFLVLVGCNKEITQTDFVEFSKKCGAQEYYQKCDEITRDATTCFHYNNDSSVLFETYTMLERCECNSNTFKDIKNDIDTEFNTNKIVSDYYINGNQYDILLVENQNALYGDFKEFGFIAINADNYYIDFYWFYDQDYDMCVDDVTSFNEFYKENFSWTQQI